jgi:hypothetical protein
MLVCGCEGYMTAEQPRLSRKILLELKKPRGHRHACTNCVPSYPVRVSVRLDADGRRTNRRIRQSSPKLGHAQRVGDARLLTKGQIRGGRQTGESSSSKLRLVECWEASTGWRHNHERNQSAAVIGIIAQSLGAGRPANLSAIQLTAASALSLHRRAGRRRSPQQMRYGRSIASHQRT